jgi:thioredoxin-like negative regulator of GroEL
MNEFEPEDSASQPGSAHDPNNRKINDVVKSVLKQIGDLPDYQTVVQVIPGSQDFAPERIALLTQIINITTSRRLGLDPTKYPARISAGNITLTVQDYEKAFGQAVELLNTSAENAAAGKYILHDPQHVENNTPVVPFNQKYDADMDNPFDRLYRVIDQLVNTEIKKAKTSSPSL